ncbi:DNA polymerase I [Skermanella mucosa]|uniref:DNA polymerase I n=1 Tax=Skermanella mucosa TaxID=1789672 RepID=UPI00192B0F8A|nr:DNA polymerase I [Skermanella mucosa]UEM20641.1 DNA polymerase I [Skermanella mucosa]
MTDTAQTDSVPTETAAKQADGLYLVDGSGFIFRAYHAIPPLTRADGTPVNAVMGFTNMLMKLLADHHAEAVAVVFDSKRLNFRNEFYADYKAHRPEPPEELKPQFGIIREAVEAFCVPSIELEGYEADDLIATYARLAREQGRQVTIVSSDKDLMQLVSDGVAMLDPMKNKPIGPEEVFEKFGVTPDKVVDVQALAGDPVDNVPGVPGIGVKTAAQLIGEYGDLEQLLERAGEIKQPKRRQALIDNAELARISKRLVRLDDQAPVPVPLDDLKVREPDHEKLLGFLRQQGFRSIITRVENEIRADGKLVDGASAPAGTAALAGGSTAPEAKPRARFDGKGSYELVQTAEALDRWIAAAYAAGTVAVDTETDSLSACSTRLVGVSMAVEQGAACYIPVGHVGPGGAPAEGSLDLSPSDAPPQLPIAEVVAKLKPLLEDPAVLKVGHNLKFDIQVFGSHGIRLAPIDDTMLISYVLETGLHGHGMDELSKLHCDYTPITYDQVTGTGKSRVTFDRVPLDKATEYAAEDADVTLRLHHALKPRLVPERLTTLYETIERPLVPVIADMEACGILVDRDVLKELSGDLASRLAELETEIHRLAGHPFNVGSPKQLGDVLFGEMGLQGGKKGKTGAYSTDSATLEPLAEQGHDIVQKVLDWRQFSKLKSTYTDSLQQQIDAKTGRVHTSFSLAITNTGRLSSNDPNLQNIPIRTEEGRKIRRAFIAKPGHVLLSVDYSQIELRLVAEMAGIEALKHAFRENIDIHAMTASQVFGVPLDQMTGEIRRKAKAINFGIIYGISGFGLGRQLGIPAGEANAFIKRYLERFSELAAFMEQTKEFCRKNGYVTTLFGRRCHIQGITERNPARRQFAERQAINAPIQGTAADIIKRAMVRIPAALEAAGLTGRMLLQVHDELVFEVPEAEAAETSDTVRRVMEGAASLGVPLVAEAGTGHSWADAH